MTDGRNSTLLQAVAALGPRLAGRPAESEAAGLVLDAFQGLGLEARLESFQFVGWEHTVPASVMVLAPERVELAAGPMSFTASTPGGGVTGRLVRIGTSYLMPGVIEWPQYAVVDGSGREVAYVLGRAEGRAFPIPRTYPHPFLMLAAVNVGGEDARRIDAWLEAGEEVRVTVTNVGRHLPGLTGQNVVARLPGRTAEEIVVSAHLDSAPGSPGASDNASGLQGVYDVAAALTSADIPEKSYSFVAFGAEEYGMLGSFFHVAERKTRGTLGPVVANVNFDAIAIGESLLCYASPDPMRALVAAEMAATGTAGRFTKVEYAETRRVVDGYPFHLEGIPNVSFIAWPYDAYHQPEDDLGMLDLDLLAELSGFGRHLIARLDAMDSAGFGAVGRSDPSSIS